ncbi:MAG: RNA 2',3'-cyclic phosphodiesterase [Elusimicrobiota bacterium]
MRLFASVEVTDDVKNIAYRIIENLKKANADVKWVEKENLHITMKFLGEQPDEKLIKIKEALKLAASNSQRCKIKIENIGTFPGSKNIRVIWLGVTAEIDKLKLLAQNVDESLSKINFEKEKREFSPHLTIGRVRSNKNISKLSDTIELLQKDELLNKNTNSVDVNELVLFQSKLSPHGPEYSVIERFHLK